MSEQFYLYRFADPSGASTYTNVAHGLTYAGEQYDFTSISHTPPTFSSDPSQARITVRMRDDLSVAMNYISHPPPFGIELRIWEVLAVSGLAVTEVAPHWAGRIVRVAWRDSFRAAELTCKTQQEIHFGREALTESLNPLCRFHIGDGRCPVNIEDFKESVVVSAKSDDVSEPTVTVTGLAQVDAYYKGGMIRTPDNDWRTVEKAVAGVLTLNRAFPATSIQLSDTVDVFAGDDLTLETCSVLYGSATNSGEAWGGWKLTPNRDFTNDGIRAV
jgi:hypothetical protein